MNIDNIKVDGTLTKPKLVGLLKNTFNCTTSAIECKVMGRDFFYGYVTQGKVRQEFRYTKGDAYIELYAPAYIVSYLMETPFGYGGGWSTYTVYSNSEDEAIEIAKKELSSKFGKGGFFKYFKVENWKN